MCKQTSRIYLFLLITAFSLELVLSACGDISPTSISTVTTVPSNNTIAAPFSTPTSVNTTVINKNTISQIFPQLADLNAASALYISTVTGTIPFYTPATTNYALNRNNAQFEGKGVFAVTSAHTERRDITIPTDVVQNLLTVFAQVSLEESKYAPVTATDINPYINISIQTKAGTLDVINESYDKSQWAMSFAGRTFVINADSTNIVKALNRLDPYLHEEVLEKLKKEMQDSLTNKTTLSNPTKVNTPTITKKG